MWWWRPCRRSRELKEHLSQGETAVRVLTQGRHRSIRDFEIAEMVGDARVGAARLEVAVLHRRVVAEDGAAERVAVPRRDDGEHGAEVLVLVRELLRERGDPLELGAAQCREVAQELAAAGGEERGIEGE